MKAKILKIAIALAIIAMISILLIIAYFMLVDIQTKIPNQEKYTCRVEAKQFMGRNIFILTPQDIEKTNLTILYFHGGAYMAEATQAHWDFLEKIANDTGATIIFPDYPLSPKYSYKDVFRMVVPLYKEVIDRISPENLVIMGDSAGGGLSLALEERLCEDNIEMPEKTILISPWLDVRLTNPKIDEVQKFDKQLNKETLKLAGLAYAREDGIDSYLVNPIDGDLSDLRNVIIYTGTYDILNPDVYILEQRAKEQGVEIQIKEYKEASHIWLIQNEEDEKELVQKAYRDLVNDLESSN